MVGPGGWFGLGPLLRARPRDFDLQAEGDTKILLIDAGSFRAAVERDAALGRNVACIISERYELAVEQLRARTFLDLEARLALRLARLIQAHGVADSRGGIALPFRLSQEELGQLVGATREAVGRTLRAWERQNWVNLAYARLVVRDREALTRLYETPTPRARRRSASTERPRI